jgi:hypothetical protein
MTPCSLLKVSRLCNRQQNLDFNYKMHSSGCCLLHVSFLIGLLFNHEGGSDMFLRNVFDFEMHADISQKM